MDRLTEKIIEYFAPTEGEFPSFDGFCASEGITPEELDEARRDPGVDRACRIAECLQRRALVDLAMNGGVPAQALKTAAEIAGIDKNDTRPTREVIVRVIRDAKKR